MKAQAVWLRIVIVVAVGFASADIAAAQDNAHEWEQFLVGRWRFVAWIKFPSDLPSNQGFEGERNPENSTVTVYREDGYAFLSHVNDVHDTGEGKTLMAWWVTPFDNTFRLTTRHEFDDDTHLDLHEILQMVTLNQVLSVSMVGDQTTGVQLIERVE